MKYEGGCHCGKVRYEVDLTIDKLLACNCSICAKRGHLLAFTPAENFKLMSGEDNLTDYLFGKRTIHHLFCSTCGVSSFARSVHEGKDFRAINARCLDGI